MSKRPSDAQEFHTWNWGDSIDKIMKAMAVEVAKVIYDQFVEDRWHLIHVDENGPVLFIGPNFDDLDRLKLTELDLVCHYAEDFSEGAHDDDWDDEYRQLIDAVITGMHIGIAKFTALADEMRAELEALEALKAKHYPEAAP